MNFLNLTSVVLDVDTHITNPPFPVSILLVVTMRSTERLARAAHKNVAHNQGRPRLGKHWRARVTRATKVQQWSRVTTLEEHGQKLEQAPVRVLAKT
jgi:hypothetical protein